MCVLSRVRRLGPAPSQTSQWHRCHWSIDREWERNKDPPPPFRTALHYSSLLKCAKLYFMSFPFPPLSLFLSASCVQQQVWMPVTRPVLMNSPFPMMWVHLSSCAKTFSFFFFSFNMLNFPWQRLILHDRWDDTVSQSERFIIWLLLLKYTATLVQHFWIICANLSKPLPKKNCTFKLKAHLHL